MSNNNSNRACCPATQPVLHQARSVPKPSSLGPVIVVPSFSKRVNTAMYSSPRHSWSVMAFMTGQVSSKCWFGSCPEGNQPMPRKVLSLTQHQKQRKALKAAPIGKLLQQYRTEPGNIKMKQLILKL